MKIVILDSVYFDDYHMEQLENIGEVVSYTDVASSDAQILSRIKDADIVITASTNISGHILYDCVSLKVISLASTGYNRIDINAANDLGIIVTNTPSYSTPAVAEQTFALLLALLKKVRKSDQYVRNGGYDWRKIRLTQLEGMTFGIVGLGAIGSRVAHIANCFGCKVIASTTCHSWSKLVNNNIVRLFKLDELFAESDIISLHIPLKATTEGLINYRAFDQMKKKPVLINTSRGKIINYDALINALTNGKISGVGLDVFPHEPPEKDDPLLKFSNAVFSPHIAFHTVKSLRKCADIVLSNISAFIEGRPENVVNNYKSEKILNVLKNL